MDGSRSKLTVAIACFLAFVVVTLLVILNVTQSIDAKAALLINRFYLGAPLTSFMQLVTQYGREYFWIPLVSVMLIFGNRGTKLLAVELATVFIVGIAAGEAMKLLIYRPRPFETVNSIITRLPLDTDSSYPSGHALIVAIGASFSLVRFKNKIIAGLLTVEAAFVCYSRVYVGLHYPLDVLGGIFLAVAIVGIGLFVLERYLHKPLKSIVDFAVRLFRDGPLNL